MRSIYLCLVLVGMLAWQTDVSAQLNIPPNDGFFTSTVNIITPEQADKFETALEDISDNTGRYIVVLFINDLFGKDGQEVAADVREEWNLPADSVLLLLSYRDRTAFVLPGNEVADKFGDEINTGIVQKDVIPRMRAGEYGLAILDGVEAIMLHLSGDYNADRYAEGGGASGFSFVVLLYSIVGLFALSWLIGTIIIFGTDYKYSLAGTLIGPTLGVILMQKYGLWLSIPPFLLLGALSDYGVHQFYKSCAPGTRTKRRRRRG